MKSNTANLYRLILMFVAVLFMLAIILPLLVTPNPAPACVSAPVSSLRSLRDYFIPCDFPPITATPHPTKPTPKPTHEPIHPKDCGSWQLCGQ